MLLEGIKPLTQVCKKMNSLGNQSVDLAPIAEDLKQGSLQMMYRKPDKVQVNAALSYWILELWPNIEQVLKVESQKLRDLFASERSSWELISPSTASPPEARSKRIITAFCDVVRKELIDWDNMYSGVAPYKEPAKDALLEKNEMKIHLLNLINKKAPKRGSPIQLLMAGFGTALKSFWSAIASIPSVYQREKGIVITAQEWESIAMNNHFFLRDFASMDVTRFIDMRDHAELRVNEMLNPAFFTFTQHRNQLYQCMQPEVLATIPMSSSTEIITSCPALSAILDNRLSVFMAHHRLTIEQAKELVFPYTELLISSNTPV